MATKTPKVAVSHHSKKYIVNGESMTALQMKEKYEKLIRSHEMVRSMPTCSICGQKLPKSKFYKDTSGVYGTDCLPVCADCLKKMVNPVDDEGVVQPANKDLVIKALSYVNKPFITEAYKRTVRAAEEDPSVKDNFMEKYIKVLNTLKQYKDATFPDSDIFSNKVIYTSDNIDLSNNLSPTDKHTLLKDREEVVRIVGNDPFLNEDVEDQAYLYSKLLSLIDGVEADDPENTLKIEASCTISKTLLQIQKIDDMMTSLTRRQIGGDFNSSEYSDLVNLRGKLVSQLQSLAAENCMTVKSSKTKSKGDESWTGKIKKLKDMNLRAAETNGFDLNTSRGMMQILDMSNQSIIKALKLEDSDYANMVAEQRDEINRLRNESDRNAELFRIILRENLDLKDLLVEKGIDIAENSVDLEELIESYDKPKDERDS